LVSGKCICPTNITAYGVVSFEPFAKLCNFGKVRIIERGSSCQQANLGTHRETKFRKNIIYVLFGGDCDEVNSCTANLLLHSKASAVLRTSFKPMGKR
jgi:hypothetical protein